MFAQNLLTDEQPQTAALARPGGRRIALVKFREQLRQILRRNDFASIVYADLCVLAGHRESQAHDSVQPGKLDAIRQQVGQHLPQTVLIAEHGWEHRAWGVDEQAHFAADGERPDEIEVQALYSRAVTPFWNVQAGARRDFRRGTDDTTHLVLGVQGLAPHWWEIDAAAFLSTDGDLTARVEAEYDQRITQRLILQPRLEVEASAGDIPELGVGSGLSGVELGLRLRYEATGRFAPYAGVEWSRALGDTADYVRAAGGEVEDSRFVVGLRAWF